MFSTLKMPVEVLEWFHTEDGKTIIRIGLGHGYNHTFQVPKRLNVPKYIDFTAEVSNVKSSTKPA